MTGWQAVQNYVDGEQVVASVLNRPIAQLAARTEYLKRMLDLKDQAKLVIDAEVSAPIGVTGIGYPSVGQPVYRVPGSDVYATAAAIVGENEWFYADSQAMAVGVVIAKSGDSSATIALCGHHAFGSSKVLASSIIADDADDTDGSYPSGRYYLSYEYGKMTASPNGPVIYVADLQIEKDSEDGKYYVTSMLVNPQYRDTGESHVHRSFAIDGKPMGGYAIKRSGRYYVYGCKPDGTVPTAGSVQSGLLVGIYGNWTHTTGVTYTLKFTDTGFGSGWARYCISWDSSGDDGAGTVSLAALDSATEQAGADTGCVSVGTHGLKIMASIASSAVTPADQTGKTWTVAMPSAARAWVDHYDSSGSHVGYSLNLGMYPAMARFVPPHPANAAYLSVAGIELRSASLFGTRKQWDVSPADASGGPWLRWYGGEVSADSTTTPFRWTSDTVEAEGRDIIFAASRMRVGPTGFVTSLQAAEGSPIRVTSAQTDEQAVQGALQLDLDIDFSTEDSGVSGHNVVKRITGSKFETGPVVEKVVAGPGISVLPDGGQGTVKISASNAVYAGDFETIALKNAKQDLAGGVFPYTKLLGWKSSGNVNSGFTAKFRVPDHIPWGAYNVIVSASVFGEAGIDDGVAAQKAGFSLKNYILADYSCTSNVPPSDADTGLGVSTPIAGGSVVIPVSFSAGYTAFDPILVHGFEDRKEPEIAQRQWFDSLLLKDGTGISPIVVYPGYFVGLEIARCSPGSSTMYEAQIGFLSLRWNLVEA